MEQETAGAGVPAIPTQHDTDAGALRAAIDQLRSRLDEHESRDGAAHRRMADDARAELDALILALDDDAQERAERRRSAETQRFYSPPDSGPAPAAGGRPEGEGTTFDRPPVDGKKERRKAGTFW